MLPAGAHIWPVAVGLFAKQNARCRPAGDRVLIGNRRSEGLLQCSRERRVLARSAPRFFGHDLAPEMISLTQACMGQGALLQR